MQITIAQDEIEAAIKNYIQEQITVKEDQEIDIDLRATRGETGFQATINITKVGSVKTAREPEAPVVQAPVATPVKPAATTTRVKPAVTKVTPTPVAAPEPEVEAEQEVVQEEEDTQSGVGQAEAPQNDPTEDAEVTNDEAETQQEEVAAPAARPSLFGGLKKPVNV